MPARVRVPAGYFGRATVPEAATARRPKGTRQPESAIVRAILVYLRLAGVFAWRVNTGALRDRRGRPVTFGTVGCPDIIGALPDGTFLGLEVKTPAGRLRPTQAAFLARLHRNRAAGAVVRSVDDVRLFLRSLGYRAP
jgi:hypothetical protein